MFLILFLLSIPILVYVVRATMGESEGFTKAATVSRLVFVSLVVLFLALLVIENFNYFLIGYRSTSIVYLMTTIAGVVYALSDKRFILNSLQRTILNFIAVIFMMGSAFLIIELIEDFEKQIIYSDSKFRLELTDKAPMSPCGLPVLYVKSGIIERKGEIMTTDTCISKEDILSVTIKEIDSSYLVRYLIANLEDSTSHLLAVRYRKP